MMLLLLAAVTQLGILGSSGMNNRNLSSSNLKFLVLTLSIYLRIFWQQLSCTADAKTQLLHFLEGIVLGFCVLGTELHTVFHVLDVFWYLFPQQ